MASGSVGCDDVRNEGAREIAKAGVLLDSLDLCKS